MVLWAKLKKHCKIKSFIPNVFKFEFTSKCKEEDWEQNTMIKPQHSRTWSRVRNFWQDWYKASSLPCQLPKELSPCTGFTWQGVGSKGASRTASVRWEDGAAPVLNRGQSPNPPSGGPACPGCLGCSTVNTRSGWWHVLSRAWLDPGFEPQEHPTCRCGQATQWSPAPEPRWHPKAVPVGMQGCLPRSSA